MTILLDDKNLGHFLIAFGSPRLLKVQVCDIRV